MTAQLPLNLCDPDALERFGIPHYGQHIVYVDVTRHMRTLRRAGRIDELKQLVEVAAERFSGLEHSVREWRKQLEGV